MLWIIQLLLSQFNPFPLVSAIAWPSLAWLGWGRATRDMAYSDYLIVAEMAGITSG